MDKKLIKPKKYNFNPKLIQERKLDAMCKKIGYESFKQSEKLKVKDSTYQMLYRNLLRGFNPKYYIVGHFNDGGNIIKYQNRRLDANDVERDLLEVKRKLYQVLYGNNWESFNKRARCFFTIEYGKSEIKPHYNLLLEKPPLLYDDAKCISNIFNKYLPRKVRCMLKDSTNVEQIGIHNNDKITLNDYINKESNNTNITIPIKVNDYIRRNKESY